MTEPITFGPVEKHVNMRECIEAILRTGTEPSFTRVHPRHIHRRSAWRTSFAWNLYESLVAIGAVGA